MVKNTVYQFVGSDLWVRYIWEGTSAKGCVEIEHWGFFVHFVLGFEENSIYTLTYVLAKILQNGASLYKSWLLVSKTSWGIWKISEKQRKVQKVEIWWAFVSK